MRLKNHLMAVIGYARVSTAEQNAALQIDALAGAGATQIFSDHGVSGAKAERPELTKMLDHLREGDTVLVWKIDRIARNTRNLLELVEGLTGRGVVFQSITEGITTTGPMEKAMLTIMGAFAELERSVLIERTQSGLAVARASGRSGGRPKLLDSPKIARAKELRAAGGMTAQEIASTLGVSKATYYRYVAL